MNHKDACPKCGKEILVIESRRRKEPEVYCEPDFKPIGTFKLWDSYITKTGVVRTITRDRQVLNAHLGGWVRHNCS